MLTIIYVVLVIFKFMYILIDNLQFYANASMLCNIQGQSLNPLGYIHQRYLTDPTKFCIPYPIGRAVESRGNSTETEDIELDDHAATLEENVLSLAEHDLVDDGIAPLPFDLVDSEQHIINVMDAAIVHGPSTMATPSPSMPTTPVAPTPTPPLAPVVSGTDAEDAQHATEAQNCTNENIENEAGRLLLSTAAAPTAAAAAVAAASTATGDSQQQPPEAETGSFTVKLKYLNDDVRMANGTPNEPIGEFTKYVHYNTSILLQVNRLGMRRFSTKSYSNITPYILHDTNMKGVIFE